MTATSVEQASHWRQKGGEAANAQWHIWRAQHGPVDRLPSDMEVELREAFTAAFTAGARWSFVESAKLAPAIADLSEFLSWLRSAGEGPRLDLEELRAAWRAVKQHVYGEDSDAVVAVHQMDLLLAVHSESTSLRVPHSDNTAVERDSSLRVS